MKIFLSIIALGFVSFIISPTPVEASRGDVYNFSWLDPDKEVYVLQNRKYRKDGRLHAYVGGGKTLSGAFVDAKTLQARVGYFFTEDWGVEFLYATTDGEENSTGQLVRDQGGARPFRRIIDDYMGGMVVWSPFYSKINTFNKILYFDWFLGLGYAKVEETNNKIEYRDNFGGAAPTTETHNALMWNLGVKFFVNHSWSIRVDLTSLHYRAETPQETNPENTWYNNFDMVFMLGYNF